MSSNEPQVSPLAAEKMAQLQGLMQGLSPQQLAWMGGYLTGAAGMPLAGAAPAAGVVASGTNGAAPLTILYGSQTGNGQKLAERTRAAAEQRGIRASVADMGEYKSNALKKEKNLLMIVSTHGEGDPPDTAVELHEFVYGKRAPKMEGTRYSVLALGDTSYDEFCKTGIDFDQRLQALGAEPVVPRVDCDVDYEEAADRWIQDVLEKFGDLSGASAGGVAVAPLMAPSAPAGASAYTKTHPFSAEVLEAILLNGRGSAKETWHIEISLEESGLRYRPGDSLGVYPSNSAWVVDAILAAGGMDPETPVSGPKGEASLRRALTANYEITTLTKPVMKKYVELGAPAALAELLAEGNKAKLKEYMEGRELVDLLSDFPVKNLDGAAFAGILRKLPPRLYSIASAYDAHPEEAHMTVGAVRYHSHGRDREGVASTFFADRLSDEVRVPVYINENDGFRLPADPSVPVIMIGPGTGIAPFRAFVEQRELDGASGKNWLFFGDQHFTTDFLYQIEWQKFLKDGILSRMDVAFSRDQEHKIYVQDRMREHAGDFYGWLQEGACVYVCGDEKKMAKDVDLALHEIVAREGGLTHDQAVDYVKVMHKEKRYQRDVY